jgi:hypothetical protein
VLRQLCEVEWNDRKPTVAGEVSLLSGHVGCTFRVDIRCGWTLVFRLEAAGTTNEEVERASRKKPVEVARRDGESRAAAPVIAKDIAAAQA